MRRNLLHRFLVGLAITVVAIFSLAVPAVATDAPSAARRTVRVGFFAFDGYHMVSSEGERSGYGYELIQGIARYNNWDIVYVGYDKSWSEMQEMLADGEIDLVTSAQKTSAREALFDFTSEDVGTSLAMLTVKSGNSVFVSGDYATYDGMRVGMINNNSRNDDFAEFAAEKGFAFTPVYYASTDALTAALQQGTDIDAALTSSLRSTKGEWILDEFSASPFYAIVKKGDSELLAEVNNAITQMDLDTPGWRTTLANKYYATDTSDQLSLNAGERSYIQSLNDAGVVLKVAVNPDNAPLSYLDGDGNPAGVFPTIFAEIARRTDVSYEYVPTKTRAEYEALVESGDVDLVVDSVFSLSDAETHGYELDDSYLSATLSSVTLKSGNGQIKTVCVPQEILAAMRSEGLSSSDEGVTFVTKDTVQECVDSVINGSCDAAYLYTYTARESMDNDEQNRLTVFLLPDYSIDVSLAVSARLDFRLASALDKASHSISAFAKQTLLTRGATSETRTTTLLGLLYANPVLILMAFAIASVLAVLLLVIYFRSREAQRERKRNTALQESANALAGALDEARQANEAKSTFLSSMSHDMRTPLNGILGFTDLALKSDNEMTRQDYLEKIKLSGNLMLDLVNDTLDLSKIESGKMTLEPQVVDAADVFGSVLNAVRVAADKKGVRLAADTSEADFGLIRVDRPHFQQIFLNLLSNAVKYTPEGGLVTITVRHLQSPVEGCNYLTTVSDTGIGMSEEFLDMAFLPFTQEHSKEAKNIEGTGLGLSIVKSIVDLMHGQIKVASTKGEGTTFSVLLPIEMVEGRAPAKTGLVTTAIDFSGRHVLLCEDNSLNAEIATTLLRDHGMEVTSATDGEEGIHAFASSEPGYFSVVLMDLRMPVMNGLEATREIRAMDRPDATSVPILAMSADAYSDDVERCLDAGMNGHIAKPVDPDKLFEELARCCGDGSKELAGRRIKGKGERSHEGADSDSA